MGGFEHLQDKPNIPIVGNPTIGSKSLIVKFSDNWVKKDYILEAANGTILRVLSKPRRKWYLMILQILTIGFYRAPYQYNVGKLDIIIGDNNEIQREFLKGL